MHPPSVALEGLHLSDEEVRQTFSDSMCIDPSDLDGSMHITFQYTHQQHSCLPFRCRACYQQRPMLLASLRML